MKKHKNQKILEVNFKDQLDFCTQITDEIRSTVDPHFLCDLPTDRIKRFFFVNRGWRLTPTGFMTVSTHYITYTSDNPSNKILTGKILLYMDDCIHGPWYVRGQQISVFDQAAHFEIQMMGGNINTFLDFRNPNSI